MQGILGTVALLLHVFVTTTVHAAVIQVNPACAPPTATCAPTLQAAVNLLGSGSGHLIAVTSPTVLAGPGNSNVTIPPAVTGVSVYCASGPCSVDCGGPPAVLALDLTEALHINVTSMHWRGCGIRASNGVVLQLQHSTLRQVTAMSAVVVQGSGTIVGIGDCVIDAVIGKSAVYATGGAQLVLVRTHIQNCRTPSSGGAVLASSAGLTVLDTTITNCSASGSGGAIAVSSSLPISISGLVARACQSLAHGGAVYMSSTSSGNLTNVLIADSAAKGYGGALAIVQVNTLTWHNVTLINNQADGGGCALLSTFGQAQLTQTVYVNCVALGDAGGGLLAQNGHSLTASGIVGSATSAAAAGGLMSIRHVSHISIANVNASSILTVGAGAIALVAADTASVRQLSCSRCDALSTGGGLMAFNVTTVTIANVYCDSCTATNAGGAMHLSVIESATVTAFSSSRCQASLAGGLGGALAVVSVTSVVISGGAHAYCQAAMGGAFVIWSVQHATVQSVYFNDTSSTMQGGAIAVGGSTASAADGLSVAILSSAMTHCNGGLRGGGIFVTTDVASLHWNDSMISGAIAATGGAAVILASSSVLSNVSISSTHSYSGVGGGVFWQGLELWLLDTSFTRCSTFDAEFAFGGGLMAFSIVPATFVGDRVSVTLCSAGAQGGGGGITVGGPVAVTLRNFQLANNTAGLGGGIALGMVAQTTILENFRLINNSASYYGGGMVLTAVGFSKQPAWNFELSGTTFIGNTAGVRGGGLVVDASYGQIVGCTFSHNSARFGTGGAVFAGGALGLLHMSHSTVALNSAATGGGIAVGDGTVWITSTSFLSNNASKDGGGLHISSARNVTIENSSFTTNTAGKNGGAMVLTSSSVLLTVAVCNFTRNAALSGNGGGMFVTEAKVQCTDLPEFLSCNWKNNAATAGLGGALAVQSTGLINCNQLQLRGGSFQGNVALVGGAVAVTEQTAPFLVAAASLHGNRALGAGGGAVFVSGSSAVRIQASALTQNSATHGGGGAALVNLPSVLDVSPDTQIQTSVAAYGGSITHPGSALAMFNSSAMSHRIFLTSEIPMTASPRILLVNSAGQQIVSGAPTTVRLSAVPPAVLVSSSTHTMIGGMVELDNFCVAAPPGGSYVVMVTMDASPLDLVPTLTSTIEISVRPCRPVPFEMLSADHLQCVKQCAPGSFSLQPTAANPICSPCPADTFSESWGALSVSQCQPCPGMTTTAGVVGASQQELCVAKVGAFARNASTPWVATACPAGANCTSTGTTLLSMESLSGYWRATRTVDKFRECTVPAFCRGGSAPASIFASNASQCATGHRGPYCLACAPGYSHSGDPFSECLHCTAENIERGQAIIIAGVVTCVLLLVIAVAIVCACERFVEAMLAKLTDPVSDSSVGMKLKVALGFFQVAWGSLEAFNIPLPFNAAVVIDNLQFVSLNLQSMVGVACVMSLSHYDSLLLITISPIVLAAVLLVASRIALSCAHRSQLAYRFNASTPGLLLLLSFLVYPSACSVTFATFPCTRFEDGTAALQADYSIDCFGPGRTGWIVYALFMVVVYPIGIPVVYWCLLWRVRARLQQPAEVTDKDAGLEPLRFLFDAYAPECWWMEVGEMVRKLLLTGVVVFLLPQSTIQIAFTVLVTVVWLCIIIGYRPYRTSSDGVFAVLVQSELALLLFSTLLLRAAQADPPEYAEQQSALLGAVMSILTIGVGVLSVSAVVYIKLYVPYMSYRAAKQEAAQQSGMEMVTNPLNGNAK